VTQTVYGVALDKIGIASSAGRYWSTPSALLRSVQNPVIPVDIEHGQVCGQVIYLERRHGQVWVVGHVSDDVSPHVPVRVGTELRHVETDFYWSVSRIGAPEHGYVLDSVALTASPARVSARPVTFLDGNAAMAASKSTDWHERDLLKRAYDYDLRRHGDPMIVCGDDSELLVATNSSYARARGPMIEIRTAAVAGVSIENREITALVAPYEAPTHVTHKGQRVREMFATGAFDNVQTQTNTIRLNMDHQAEKVIGKAVEWDTHNLDGLVGTFHVARTTLGDEALELAANDCVDCSVGFGVVNESWPQKDLRLVREAWLDHVALTSMPAYPGARVLGVRGELASAR
jgi:HK97 family phage prohead protease